MKNEILKLKEAAKLLNMAPETLRRKTFEGKAPGFKSGKNWIYIYDDLILYIRSQYYVKDNFYIKNLKPRTNTNNTLNSKRHKTFLLHSHSIMSRQQIKSQYKKMMKK